MTIAYQHNKALLRIYLYYRLLLATFLLSMFVAGVAHDVLGSSHPTLFYRTVLCYAAINLVTLIAFRIEKLQTSVNRIFASLIVDLVAILLIVHGSGGIENGLGYLLLVNIAMASVFLRTQLCLAYAALTSLFIIGETVYLAQSHSQDSGSIFSAGILGILTFSTALAFSYLTNKVRASDIEAAYQAQFAEHLQRLAQLIVARMRTGIIVVDADNQVELINQSAIHLLGVSPERDYQRHNLKTFSNLTELVDKWRASSEPGGSHYYIANGGQEIRINFATLETGSDARTLLFLEDHRLLAQQAQQLKLASLGRLTASIAHEVRNPLGAISHAAQLLSESPHIHASDQRLTEIIHQHSQRVNQIVENTLVLSRRRNPNPELIQLDAWLTRFIYEYSAGKDVDISLEATGNAIAKVDPIQLNQVLTNLCDNGLRYSKMQTGKAHITLQAGLNEHAETSYLAVIDDGPGVTEDMLQQIFDPFFTTDERGSGLGLYISKELCEINQASLRYRRTRDGKSCFLIDFSHHQRIF